MKKFELFEVLIRTIGFIVFLKGLYGVCWAFWAATRPVKLRRVGDPQYTWWNYVSSAAPFLLAGLLLMAWAEGIARMFYSP
jgi:hypothetical protein